MPPLLASKELFARIKAALAVFQALLATLDGVLAAIAALLAIMNDALACTNEAFEYAYGAAAVVCIVESGNTKLPPDDSVTLSALIY